MPVPHAGGRCCRSWRARSWPRWCWGHDAAVQGRSNLVGDREPGSVRVYSAGPAHYLAALPSSVIYGAATGALGGPEKRLFIGLVPLGLVAIGLWPPLDRRRIAYALALALAIDGTLGHRGLLYPWLRDHVGVFMGLRVPARFGHLVLLGASVLAGFGLARVRRRVDPAHQAAGRVAAWAVGILVIAEYMMWPMRLVPVQTAPDEVSRWLRSAPPGIVAELPLPRTTADIGHDAVAAYRSTFHWQRILNGYSGFYRCCTSTCGRRPRRSPTMPRWRRSAAAEPSTPSSERRASAPNASPPSWLASHRDAM